MKQFKNIRYFCLFIFLGLVSNFASAQNQSCNNISINSIDIKQSNIDLILGYPVITDDKGIKFEIDLGVSEGKGSSDYIDFNVTINGYFKSNNSQQLDKFTKTVSGKEIQIAAKKVVKWKAGADLEGSTNKPAVITSIIVSVSSLCNGKSTEVTNTFDNFKLENGRITNILKGEEFKSTPTINHVGTSAVAAFGIFAVVIAYNSTGKKPTEAEIAMNLELGTSKGTFVWQIEKDKQETRAVKPTSDKDGNWTFRDSVAIKDSKNPPVLVSFEIEYITLRKDTFKYISLYKQKLADKKPYDYKVRMEGGPRLIYGEIGGTSQTYLSWRPRKAMPNTSTINTAGNVEIRENAEYTLGVGGLNITNSKHKDVKAKIKIEVVATSKRESISIIELTATYNSEKQIFEASTNFNGSEKTPIEISKITVILITENKDTIIYEYEGNYGYSLDEITLYTLLKKTEKNKYDDPCKTKYKLKNIDYAENNLGGMYTYQFWLKFENNSDVPDNVAMVVEIKDCNGKNQYVEIRLKYDDKSQTYIGSQVITAAKECKLELVYGEIGAYNSCGDESAWSFKASESKSNGKGTRVVATTSNGTPGLL
jgi:hypothetical protein